MGLARAALVLYGACCVSADVNLSFLANYSRCLPDEVLVVAAAPEQLVLRDSHGLCDKQLRHTDAIIILGQLKHSSYDTSHSSSLAPVLASLEYFYPYVNNSDVLLWHEGEIQQSDLPGDLSFPVILCNLSATTAWGFPQHGLSRVQSHLYKELLRKETYAQGYYFMMRFYAITIWKLLHSLGYKYMLRLDDDSRILSCVPYNIFDNLRRSKAIYGFRQYSYECELFRSNFGHFVDAYCEEQGISQEALGLESQGYCGGVGSMGFYNNFYVTNIEWWLSPTVQHFIDAFDKANRVFASRDNDLIFQTRAFVHDAC